MCRLGSYYARLPDGGRSLFAPGEGEARRGRVVTQLQSLRVRCVWGNKGCGVRCVWGNKGRGVRCLVCVVTCAS